MCIRDRYSIGYMRGHHEKNQTGYFAAFAACLASAVGIALASNLITFFIFYEMLTLATYPLVAHYRDDKAKASGRKYPVSYTHLDVYKRQPRRLLTLITITHSHIS